MGSNLPDDIIKRIQELEERVRRLETAPTAKNTSVRGGSFRILRDDGTPQVILNGNGLYILDADGDLRLAAGNLGGGHSGFLLLDADGLTQRFAADEDGMLLPYLTIPWFDLSVTRVTNSPAFVNVGWETRIESISHKGLYAWLYAYCDAGTTGEIRVAGPGGLTATSPVAVTSSPILQQFKWLHGQTLGQGPFSFYMQARRTGGTGLVYLAAGGGVSMVDPGYCTATGL